MEWKAERDMSSRERWTVYPLLFFALGLGLRDKMIPATSAEYRTLACGELTLVAADNRELVSLRPSLEGGAEMMFYTPSGESLLTLGMDVAGKGARVEGVSRDGAARFALRAEPRGATSQFERDDTRIHCGFNLHADGAGLWATDRQETRLAAPDQESPSPDWGLVLPTSEASPDGPDK